jgi:hypothetical protein
LHGSIFLEPKCNNCGFTERLLSGFVFLFSEMPVKHRVVNNMEAETARKTLDCQIVELMLTLPTFKYTPEYEVVAI